MEEHNQDLSSLIDLIANAFQSQPNSVSETEQDISSEQDESTSTKGSSSDEHTYPSNLAELANITVEFIRAFVMLEQVFHAYYKVQRTLNEKLNMVHQSPEELEDTYLFAFLLDRFLYLSELKAYRAFKKMRFQPNNWDKRLESLKEQLGQDKFRSLLQKNSLLMKEVIYYGEALAKRHGFHI